MIFSLIKNRNYKLKSALHFPVEYFFLDKKLFILINQTNFIL